MTKITLEASLHPDHLQDLRRSGLSDETILEAGIRSVPPNEIRQRLGFDIPGTKSCMEIPYDKKHSRFKILYHDGQDRNANGESKPRYLATKDSGCRLYIPTKVKAFLKDTTVTLYITEGEKKSLKLTQEGLPAVATAGLWSWMDGSAEKRLIRDFNEIALEGREVVLVPDSDWSRPPTPEKPSLKSAVWLLADKLLERGAKVSIVPLLQEGEDKTGVDDYLCKHGIEEFLRLPKKQHLPLDAIISHLDVAFPAECPEEFVELLERIAYGNPLLSEALFRRVSQLTRVDMKVLRGFQGKLKEPAKKPKTQKAVTRVVDEEKAQSVEQLKLEVVGDFNKRFAVLLGGDVGVLNFRENGNYDLWSLTEFALATKHEKIALPGARGELKPQQKSEIWLDSPNRRTFHGVEFNPENTTPGFLNTWRGWPIQPDPSQGSFGLFREHLETNVCQNNPEYITFVWNFFASIFQKPTEKQGHALVLTGSKGSGKTIVGQVIGKLLGDYYLPVSNQAHLVGKFNSHLERCLFLQLDEVAYNGDREAAGALKHLITSEWLTVEEKYQRPRKIRNFTRIFLTAEKGRICSADDYERRFAIFKLSDTHRNDTFFFKNMLEELGANNDSGYKALLHFLLNYPIEDRLPIPKTEALQEQQSLNFDPIVNYLISLCQRGELPCDGLGAAGFGFLPEITMRPWQNEWFEVPTHIFREHFRQFVGNKGYVLGDVALGKAIFTMIPDVKKRRVSKGGKQVCCYVFPPLQIAAKSLEQRLEMQIFDDHTENRLGREVYEQKN